MLPLRFAILCASVSCLMAAGVTPEERVLAESLASYERVRFAASPALPDIMRCLQTQAGALPVVRPEGRYLIYFRQGLCTYASAARSGASAEYKEARQSFARAIKAWPIPVSAVPRVMAAIASLERGRNAAAISTAETELRRVLAEPVCAGVVLEPAMCRELTSVARLWLGWAAARKGNAEDAARLLEGLPYSGWRKLVQARLSAARGAHAEAAAILKTALESWPREDSILTPRPDIAEALYELGREQLLAGRPAEAAAALSDAIKGNPRNTAALYARARARQILKEHRAAIEDLDRAYRIALANEDETAQAHLYRGAALLARNEYAAAETEFGDALNSSPSDAVRAEANLWWRLAAVAGGACAESAGELLRLLPSAPAMFPVDEARDRLASCTASISKAVR